MSMLFSIFSRKMAAFCSQNAESFRFLCAEAWCADTDHEYNIRFTIAISMVAVVELWKTGCKG